ncbi:MAG: imidazolonepropionase, partial [Gammaproteobacteria bacterium]
MSGGLTLWTDVHLITLSDNGEPYGLIKDGAITAQDGRIVWLGKQSDIPEEKYSEIVEYGGRFMTPGLIDCHTHLVYGGDRVSEFEMRLQGVDYEEIARRGGGIISTVRQTREASEEELVSTAGKRLEHFIREGVTTIEIKSGYGLDSTNEFKLLRAIRALADQSPITLEATFLGAHAIPPEFEDKADSYIDIVCNEMLPMVAEEKLAS